MINITTCMMTSAMKYVLQMVGLQEKEMEIALNLLDRSNKRLFGKTKENKIAMPAKAKQKQQ